jgi:hypothetical protein
MSKLAFETVFRISSAKGSQIYCENYQRSDKSTGLIVRTLHKNGTPTKRQVSKRQVSKRPVSKRLVSKRLVFKFDIRIKQK